MGQLFLLSLLSELYDIMLVNVPVSPNLATVRYPKAWLTNRLPWIRISLSNMSSMSVLTVLDKVMSSSEVKEVHVHDVSNAIYRSGKNVLLRGRAK